MKKKRNTGNGKLNIAIPLNQKAAKKPIDSTTSSDTKVEDWISNLAKKSTNDNQHTNSNGTSSIRVLSKEQRIERRAAKKRRREERRGVTKPNESRKRTASSMDQKEQQQEQEQPPPRQHMESINQGMAMDTQICIKKLSIKLQKSINRLYKGKTLEERKYAKPFQTPIEKGKAKAGHKLSDSLIQPRKNDYGGLGLARPSLLLDLRDVSFVPKLEEEFAEHVPGFFGKQRTKAMKRQLDGNMLWRRLSSSKANGKYDDPVKHVKVNGKKLSEMTPDERVEAMIQLNMI